MSTETQPRVVVSGMRSTGRLHLGHLFGALQNWSDLQEEYDCFYFAADWHALTSDYDDPSNIATSTLEMLADWIACGVDPERSTLFVQSMVPEHAELALLLGMITPLGWLERVPTYKQQIRELANKDLNTHGFLGYPVLQSADVLIYRGNYVPVGEDQTSHLELSREITRRFNGLYGEVFPEPQPLFTPAPRVPGLDGRKMSKSYGNAIDLADDPDTVREKCLGMFSDPERVRRDDPGVPERCNVHAFFRLIGSDELQQRVAEECRSAELGCLDAKRILADEMVAFLEPIRRRREELVRAPEELFQILRAGTERARERAGQTLERVREAMSLDYESRLQELRS